MWYMLVPAPHLTQLFYPRLVDDIYVFHGKVIHLLDPERAARRDPVGRGAVGDVDVILTTPVRGVIEAVSGRVISFTCTRLSLDGMAKEVEGALIGGAQSLCEIASIRS